MLHQTEIIQITANSSRSQEKNDYHETEEKKKKAKKAIWKYIISTHHIIYSAFTIVSGTKLFQYHSIQPSQQPYGASIIIFPILLMKRLKLK